MSTSGSHTQDENMSAMFWLHRPLHIVRVKGDSKDTYTIMPVAICSISSSSNILSIRCDSYGQGHGKKFCDTIEAAVKKLDWNSPDEMQQYYRKAEKSQYLLPILDYCDQRVPVDFDRAQAELGLEQAVELGRTSGLRAERSEFVTGSCLPNQGCDYVMAGTYGISVGPDEYDDSVRQSATRNLELYPRLKYLGDQLVTTVLGRCGSDLIWDEAKLTKFCSDADAAFHRANDLITGQEDDSTQVRIKEALLWSRTVESMVRAESGYHIVSRIENIGFDRAGGGRFIYR